MSDAHTAPRGGKSGESASQCAAQVVGGIAVAGGNPGLPNCKISWTSAGDRPRASRARAIHRSTMLQSGWGKRCAMCQRRIQVW